MRDTPVRGPIVPPIAEATRQLMTPAPAAPDLDCYVPIVRSPRRRILQQLRQGIKTATAEQNFQPENRESMHAG
jgi:hypothetical protein